MTSSTASVSLTKEFDSFLQATLDIGTGMRLSVLSALARLDLDPWQEAATLADLSRSTASQRLRSLIASLPGASELRGEAAAATADRLIELLPYRTRDRPQISQRDPADKRRRLVITAVAVIVVVVVTLVMAITAPHEASRSKSVQPTRDLSVQPAK